jgi:hypothetical protein
LPHHGSGTKRSSLRTHTHANTNTPAHATRATQELGGLLAEGGGDAKGELTSYLQGLADDMRPMDYAVEDVA